VAVEITEQERRGAELVRQVGDEALGRVDGRVQVRVRRLPPAVQVFPVQRAPPANNTEEKLTSYSLTLTWNDSNLKKRTKFKISNIWRVGMNDSDKETETLLRFHSNENYLVLNYLIKQFNHFNI
jgi:hypothetical protein